MKILVPRSAGNVRPIADQNAADSSASGDGTRSAGTGPAGANQAGANQAGANLAGTDAHDLLPGDPALPHVIVSDQVFADPAYQPVEFYGEQGRSPVIASCPHAGRNYPAALMRQTTQPLQALRGLEDFGVDCLLASLPDTGISLLVNRVARGYLDVNRDSTALDDSMFEDGEPANDNRASLAARQTTHVRAGYGLLPRLTANRRPIYQSRLPATEAHTRIAAVHTPYHAALETLVEAAHARHGSALLVDFHSMPAHDRQNNRLPDIILGDGHGVTLNSDLGKAIATHLGAAGLTVGWNHPYAGGHITRRYGDARSTRQSLQIEINRALYMDGKDRLNLEKSKELASLITDFGSFLVQQTRQASAD